MQVQNRGDYSAAEPFLQIMWESNSYNESNAEKSGDQK